MIIPDIRFGEETWDVSFDSNGNVEKVMLYVGYMAGFSVDMIDVTEQVSKYAKEKFEELYIEHERLRSEKEYEPEEEEEPQGAA